MDGRNVACDIPRDLKKASTLSSSSVASSLYIWYRIPRSAFSRRRSRSRDSSARCVAGAGEVVRGGILWLECNEPPEPAVAACCCCWCCCGLVPSPPPAADVGLPVPPDQPQVPLKQFQTASVPLSAIFTARLSSCVLPPLHCGQTTRYCPAVYLSSMIRRCTSLSRTDPGDAMPNVEAEEDLFR